MNKLRNSLVSGQIPAVSMLAPGDIGVNNADGTIYVLKQNGTATAIVQIGGITSFNARTGDITLTSADVIAALGYTPISPVSPAFSGTPTAPTATLGSSTTQLATTEFVTRSLATYTAPIPTLALSDLTDVAVTDSSSIDGYTLAYSNSAQTWIASKLSPVAFSGKFSDLTGAPTSTVTSFNTRTGAITLIAADVTSAGGALLASPTFTGTPSAPTATAGTSTTQLATTAFVTAAVTTAAASGVVSFNTRTGMITLTSSDVTTALGYTPGAKFDVVPTGSASAISRYGSGFIYGVDAYSATDMPTSTTGDTGFYSGLVVMGTNRGMQLMTNWNSEGVGDHGVFVRVKDDTQTAWGTWTRLATVNDVTAASPNLSGYAPLASPALTGNPTAPTATAGDNDTSIATTAFVTTAVSAATANLSLYAPKASPALTGTPTAPTATAGTNTTQLATTAFVASAVVAASPNLSGYAPLASPGLTGTPTAPTATVGTNTTQLATTAFVASAVVASSPNLSGYAPLASPALTGTPTAPTATAGTNTTQLATTAFVANAVSAYTPNLSGYAPLASPTFTGVPLAPTASAGTSTTQVATTAFVQATKYYDVVGGAVGAITASQLLVQFVSGRTVTFPAGLTGSQGYALIAPAASATFTISANGVNVGTMVFAAAAHTASFTASSTFTLTPGQLLLVTGPASTDTTLQTVSFTLLGQAA